MSRNTSPTAVLGSEGYKANASRRRAKECFAERLVQANLWAGCLETLADGNASLTSGAEFGDKQQPAGIVTCVKTGGNRAGGSGDKEPPSSGDAAAGPITAFTPPGSSISIFLTLTTLAAVEAHVVVESKADALLKKKMSYRKDKLCRGRVRTVQEGAKMQADIRVKCSIDKASSPPHPHLGQARGASPMEVSALFMWLDFTLIVLAPISSSGVYTAPQRPATSADPCVATPSSSSPHLPPSMSKPHFCLCWKRNSPFLAMITGHGDTGVGTP
ncbi:hypothetical protein BESB_030710 [Besnoitia besnoiti]|uniref:Uncharacterized protein n=1 Tax=Besnoitia besnoiti TaxID=94643 RepID=A0A2A9M6D1_BESBE|nr:hypothetical protein BESB_030710 [Besnoitia besnoiti]PFH31197.1 hypothetical protein BESB_030710 [Besnoitia besnoiti]